MNIVELIVAVVAVTLFAYWAWYTLLMHLGLVLRERPQNFWEGLSVGLRELPKAILYGGYLLVTRLAGKWKPQWRKT